MSNEIIKAQPRQQVMAAEPIFDTAIFEHMTRIATLMGTSNLLPAHLRVMKDENGREVALNDRTANMSVWLDEKATIANAFLIVSAARNFGGIDPFALAQHSYFVHGRLGYEGKLVQALIERRVGAMEFKYNDKAPTSEDFGITVTAWVPNASPERQASVTGTVRDWASRKNGALNRQWQGEGGARRMLHYRGTREWARLYAPALVLGLLDDDDLEAMREDYRSRSARQVAGPGREFNPLASDAADPAGYAKAAQQVQARDPDEADHVAVARPTPPHDPQTGEVREEAQEGAASGQEQPEAPQAPAEPLPAAGGTPEATEQPKPATKRLPRGMPQRVDIACMEIVKAADEAALQAAWTQYAVPIITEITQGDYPRPAIDRLYSAKEQRQANWATVAKASPAATAAAPAPAATAPETPAAPTAEQVEQPAPEEQAEDWGPFLDHLRGLLAVARTFEDVDDVVDSQASGRDMPKDVEARVDDMVAERRREIGDANASAPAPAPADAAADFPGNAAIQDAGPVPTADQMQDMVDEWVATMRKCRTLEDLEMYNDEVIKPWVQGPHGKLLPEDLYQDAAETFKSRQRLLAAKEREQR